MSVLIPVAEKACQACGKPLERKRYSDGRLEYRAAFERRKCCDKACMGALQARLNAAKHAEVEPPNPSGLCWCGCGGKTPIATWTCRRPRDIRVKGEPMRYIKGHSSRGRGQMPWLRDYLDRRSEALTPRRETVEQLWCDGLSLRVIARAIGGSQHDVMNDVRWLREQDRCGWRRRRIAVDDRTTARIADLWRGGSTVGEIADEFGWDKRQARYVVEALVRLGTVPRREYGEDLPPTGWDRRGLRSAYRKADTAPVRGDKQRMVLRLIATVGVPVTEPSVRALLAMLGDDTPKALGTALAHLHKRGLLERAPAEDTRYARWAWFIPFGAERAADSLTLGDARREMELARLVREQETDADRGDFVNADGSISLDMQIGEGGTFYDVIRARR